MREYLNFGAFPEVVLSQERFQKEKILRTYLDETFLKDFVERHKIRNMEFGRLEDTLSVFFVEKISSSIYSRKEWPKKIYIVDTGLSIPIGFSEDVGKKMENAVFLELLRKTNEHPLMEIYYWKDHSGKEVDFVIKEANRIRELIQVTYASYEDEINERQIKSLLKASRELKCKNLTVITRL